MEPKVHEERLLMHAYLIVTITKVCRATDWCHFQRIMQTNQDAWNAHALGSHLHAVPAWEWSELRKPWMSLYQAGKDSD